MRGRRWWFIAGGMVLLGGCTVKAVGDPNRPITIQAHITLDVRGLQQTATNIEDMVSQGAKPQGGASTQ